MNWKLLLGCTLNRAENLITDADISFVHKNFPYGRNWIYDISRKYITAPKCIVDVGANVGEISISLAKRFNEAKIIAFEPIKSTYQELRGNVKAYDRIITEELALSDKSETFEIFLNAEHTINSLNATTEWEQNIGSQKVECITLDDYCKSKDITKINILKIDVEGFESKVLGGAQNMLSGGVDTIFIEVGFEREKNKMHFSDVETVMEKYDFQLCGIYEIRRNWFDKGRLWYANFLYVHKSLINL